MAERKSRAPNTPLIEWIVGGFGALVFAAMVAVLTANALTDPGGLPSIVTSVERIEAVEGGYAVAFTARNEGDTTAAMVEITAEAGGETHSATIDYLPPRSQRRGGVFFERDPRGGELKLRAEGYQDP
ncbi:MAG: TIGR02588 family protein [Phycisphaerales bacterium]|nr:TIGR02588 family protein [Hyphomonadaceae bacterium]